MLRPVLVGGRLVCSMNLSLHGFAPCLCTQSLQNWRPCTESSPLSQNASNNLLSAPIAGGQYFWVSMLAPNGYKRFASYITGKLSKTLRNGFYTDRLQDGSPPSRG